jgi:hypothetical protein
VWDNADAPTICLAIPGPWDSREQIQRRLVRESARHFAMLGSSIVRTKDLAEFPFDVVEHDPLLAGAMRAGSRGRIASEDVDRIARHRCTVYVRGEGGSTDAARAMADVASALLRAGGLGVLIESSGSAVARDEWSKYADPAHPAGLYWAYVALVAGRERGHYSCGMHTFGLRDAVTDILYDPEPLAALVHNFLGLTFATRPPIKDGDEFADDESGIAYRVRGEPCSTYPPTHMQHNPYGMWRIELVE